MASTEGMEEPFPHRIVDHVGSGFCLGAAGGAIYHFIRELYKTPPGKRFIPATRAAIMNAPRSGGSLAAWGFVHSGFEYLMACVRQKEDPWNYVVAGAAMGALVGMGKRLMRIGSGALICALLSGLLEGAGIMLNRAPCQLTPIQQPKLMRHMQGIANTQGIHNFLGSSREAKSQHHRLLTIK